MKRPSDEKSGLGLRYAYGQAYVISDPDKARLSVEELQRTAASPAAQQRAIDPGCSWLSSSTGQQHETRLSLDLYDSEDDLLDGEHVDGNGDDDDDDDEALVAAKRGRYRRTDSNTRNAKVEQALREWRRLSSSNRVKKALTSIAVATILICIVTWVATAVRFAHSVDSASFVPTPRDVEPGVPRVSHQVDDFDPLRELETRLSAAGLSPSTLSCRMTDQALAQEYEDLRSSDRTYLFALNLYNNERVFPTLAKTLIRLSDFLGRTNVHVSIFENGSTDRTTLAMAHFAAVLTAAGVPHTIVSDHHKTDWKRVDRIDQLAVYRNIALAPVKRHQFDDVVFVNDVFACPSDVLELISQRKIQQADAVCGMDWRRTSRTFSWLGLGGSVKFYDNWVARSIDGALLRARFDVLGEFRNGIRELFPSKSSRESRDRFRAARPLPVYSCWNGMIVLDAKPFVNHGDGDGRAIEFRSAFGSEKECAASECKLLARDFWQAGFKRWLMVPSVHVTYDESVYDDHELESLRRKAKEPAPDGMNDLVDWSTFDEPENVVCIPWLRGWMDEVPFRSHKEGPYR